MPNRFSNPFDQFLNSAGVPYAGGKLYFYATASSTPLATYNDPDLDTPHANSNPVVLDSAGRLPNAVFLQTLAYKVTLTDANGAQVWTADPVSTSDFTAWAKPQTYAGNPNGNLAGTSGTGSGPTQIPADMVWDRTNGRLYVCSTTGVAADAVWTQVTANLDSSILFSAAITPTALAANTNNWAPTGFSTAYQVRVSSSSAVNLTGLAGGAAGREILLSNVGSYVITLSGNSGSSSAGNLFLMGDVALGPGLSLTIYYDGTSAGWRLTETVATGKQTIWVPASAMVSRTTNGPSAGSVEMGTNKNMFITKDFDTTTQEFVQFEVWFPKSWNLGTVTFQPQWSHAATVTNFGVVWGLAGVAFGNTDVGDAAFGTAVTSTSTGGVTNSRYLGPESAAITIAGTPTAGDTVMFQLNRTVADGSDTLGVDARLHGCRVFFTTQALNDA